MQWCALSLVEAEDWLSLVVVRGLLIVMASLLQSMGSGYAGFSKVRRMGSAVVTH